MSDSLKIKIKQLVSSGNFVDALNLIELENQKETDLRQKENQDSAIIMLMSRAKKLEKQKHTTDKEYYNVLIDRMKEAVANLIGIKIQPTERQMDSSSTQIGKDKNEEKIIAIRKEIKSKLAVNVSTKLIVLSASLERLDKQRLQGTVMAERLNIELNKLASQLKALD